MKIQEYLQAKYKVQKATTMLKLEAHIFGIEYPNRYGWWERLANRELTEEMRQKLIGKLMAGNKNSRIDGLASLGVHVEPKPQTEKQIPNPPGTNPKRAKQIARKKAKNLLKAARHAQSDKHDVTYAKPLQQVVLASMPYVPMPPPSGVDPRTSDFLMTYEWRRVRMMALKRYGAVCQCCGASPQDGAVMNVDHIKPRKFFPQLALDVENLQILCNPCNEGKGNWDMTDWRHEEPESDPLHESNMAHLRSI